MLKAIVLTKDTAFGGRGSSGRPANQHSGSSLITVQDRAEVDDDKVVLFSGSQRLVLLEKDRCD